MNIDDRIIERMRTLSIIERASLISSFTRFDNGKIEEHDVNRDIQTLTAFIDATGSGLPDNFCSECLCETYGPSNAGGHNWGCSKNPNKPKQKAKRKAKS